MIVALALGALGGLGLCAVGAGLLGARLHTRAALAGRSGAIRLGIALALGVLAYLVTTWPVAGLAGAGLGAFLPNLVSGRGRAKAALARAEALASWTEMLRDTMGVGVGLGQAIAATAQVAPQAIAEEVGTLAQRAQRQPASLALRRFAADLDDPTADLVVAALVANEERSGNLGQVLSSLSVMARDQVAMRTRVGAARASVEAAVRIITVFVVLLMGVLFVANRAFFAPFSSAAGQGILALGLSFFAASFAWLAHLRKMEAPARVLAPAPGVPGPEALR